MTTRSKDLGEIVRSYLIKYPMLENRRLARLINSDYPLIDKERARASIRYYRGVRGNSSRVNTQNSMFWYQRKDVQPYDLPSPHNEDLSPFIINGEIIIIFADIHFPYQSNIAIRTAIEWCKKKFRGKKITILLNGDIVDCYQMSNFRKCPSNPSIKQERNCFYDFMEVINEELEPEMVFYKKGNHELRIQDFVFTKCAELAEEVDENGLLHFDTIFKAKEYGFKTISDKKIIKIGNLNVIHGHEVGKSFGQTVSPARTLFLKTKASTFENHFHTTTEYTDKNINDTLITCWSSGCLCDLKPLYRPINNWNHGFSVVFNERDLFRVMNMRIDNSVVY